MFVKHTFTFSHFADAFIQSDLKLGKHKLVGKSILSLKQFTEKFDAARVP